MATVPSPSKDARPYHHGDLPRALLEAAVQAIAEVGPAAVSLRDLARRTGVSHAAPAHHFGDKAGLLTAVATVPSRSAAGGWTPWTGWWSTTTRRSSRFGPRRTGCRASCSLASRNRRRSRTGCTSTSGPTTGTLRWLASSTLALPAPMSAREQTWVVLSDPEGNEFCVLAGRRP